MDDHPLPRPVDLLAAAMARIAALATAYRAMMAHFGNIRTMDLATLFREFGIEPQPICWSEQSMRMPMSDHDLDFQLAIIPDGLRQRLTTLANGTLHEGFLVIDAGRSNTVAFVLHAGEGENRKTNIVFFRIEE